MPKSATTLASSSVAASLNQISQTLQAIPGFNWFLRRGYGQGAFWATMIGVVSVMNDVVMCKLGDRFNPIEIVFFRYLFSMCSVLLLMLPHGRRYFVTQQKTMHGVRALIGAVALGLCCYSVHVMPLAENTTILFTIPLFFLPMARFFLKEKVDAARWIATLVGFLGILVVVQPGTDAFRLVALIPISAAVLFAVSNVMIKSMIRDEHSFTMLFYFGLGTTILAAVLLPFVWIMPTLSELAWMLLLGVGANLIQVCIYRAYASADASSVAPYAYTEMVLSALSGFVFFGQIPHAGLYFGSILIAGSTLFMTLVEAKRARLQKHCRAEQSC
jgi:S-adenosylmethionine uptake transporter